MKPVIWVSRCVMGDRVRYDGGHKHDGRMATLAEVATLVPICPEVEAGLGVPRPPIDLVGDRVIDRAADRDVTDLLDAAIDNRLRAPKPHAFIGKGRSPSCAHGTAKRIAPTGFANGRFVQRLQRRWPDLPICDIEDLTLEFLVAVWRRAGVEEAGLREYLAHRPGVPAGAAMRLAIEARSERELLALGSGGAAVRRRTTEVSS